jgi:hypothetical protein
MNIKYLNYFKTIVFGFVFLTLPFALMEQFLFQKASLTSNKVFYGTIGIILGLIESFLALAVLGFGVKKLQVSDPYNYTVGQHFKKYLRDIVIESFRAMGRIAVGFLLIVPGILRLARFYLVPYIVQFDSEYEKGRVDALEEATSLLKGRFFKFFALLFLTQVVGLVVQIIGIRFNLFTSPIPWILFYVVEVLLQITVFWLFYNYYVYLKSSFTRTN